MDGPLVTTGFQTELAPGLKTQHEHRFQDSHQGEKFAIVIRTYGQKKSI
jgi:hypothetical protein